MKKAILLAVAVNFIISNANSQITKRNWMIGGSGEFISDKTIFPSGDATKSTQININPKIGYFVADRFALGAFFTLGVVANTSIGGRTRYTNTGIGPFIRYYFLSPEKNTNIVIEGNGAYTQQSNNLISDKSPFISYALLTGPIIYFNSSVGIEFLLGYKGYQTLQADTKNGGFHFNVGIQVHLEKDK
jgi:hypothetical protein